MKICKIAIVLLLMCAVCSPALAAKIPSNKWDNLLDVAYKFTWYPKKDLQNLLAKKAGEYEQGLEEYQNLVMEELTKNGKGGKINPDLLIRNKSWKKYYRLAIAQFCLFLASDNQLYLENAKSVLSVLSGKTELSNVAFWHYLFQAYSDLVKKDRDAFVRSVLHLWQDVVLKLEIDEILTDSEIFKTEFIYENIAHLIITRAIVQNTIPDLYPLSVIILSIKDKLISDNGYKNIVKAIAERMHGLKSDNFNLNFAVSFVEATANQYDFEDEKSSDLIVSKYNLARVYYELALSWANTRKGKAAILTQYMGFNNYVIRRLIDGDNLLAANPFFTTLSGKGNQLVEDSMALYAQLSKPQIIKSEFAAEGFNKKSDYIEAMHQLWDSSAQLLMMLFSYYKTDHQSDQIQDRNVAESVLLRYLLFFNKYAEKNSEIVPDNAFFLAAYATNELSELYRQAMNYSTEINVNDLALSYQFKSIEIFPLDIIGILKLAHQINQEGRHNRYRKHISPLALRLRASKVASIWLNNYSTDYNNSLAMISNVIPDIIDNACFLVNFLRNSVGSDSEESVYNKTVVMLKLLMALKANGSEEVIHDALSSIAIQDFTDKNKTVTDIIQIALPKDLHVLAKSIPGIETRCRITRLKNELYASPDNPIHSYLRELYYEKSQ